MFVKIAEVNGYPQQILENVEDYHQEVLKMSESVWQEILSKILAQPLELIGGRLFQFYLVETEKAKYFLRKCHHIIFDDMTYQTIFDDISAAYDGKELFPENYDAIDFANDESISRTQPNFKDARNWYEKTFSGLEVEALPIPDHKDTEISFNTFNKTFKLDYSALKNFCTTNKISAAALTSTAFAILLGTYTYQQESLFSTIYHGRNDRTKNIVGMFVKTLPVYCHWTNNEKISDLIAEMTENIKSAQDNDLFSYADLNQICPMNNTPMFAYHGLIKTISEFCGKPCHEEVLDKKLPAIILWLNCLLILIKCNFTLSIIPHFIQKIL